MRRSLFIQVSSYPPQLLAQHLDHVRTHHRDYRFDDYIYNAVLDEIEAIDGGLHPNLSVIVANKHTFDNIFVGSANVWWPNSGSHYVEGILNADHRWHNLRKQRELWQLVATDHPDLVAHWYINYEGVLDHWDNPDIRAAWEAYLIQSVRDIPVKNRAILWSPSIWKTYQLNMAEERAIQNTFRNIKRIAPPGITWLHLQDGLGRGWAGLTLSDVKQWYHELEHAYKFNSLRVNMEMHRLGPDGISVTAEDPAVMRIRERYYADNGIPLGACWELRWWMQNHQCRDDG